jgi:uncharacterized protein DUF1236
LSAKGFRRGAAQIAALQQDVVVLLPGALEALVAQHLERTGDAFARAVRHDHFVDIAALGRHERIGEAPGRSIYRSVNRRSGAQLGIPIVVPTGVGAVVATPPVGAMVAVPPAAVVEPVIPAPEVLSYVVGQPIQQVFVDGEVMVGATLPAAVPVYPVPASPYVYSYINGQRVLVEPAARRIVYVVR